MASRKAKTTGTSTRKRNLLLRATGPSGGTFRADGNRLLQIAPTGRTYTGAYYLLREDLRRMLQRKATGFPIPVYYNNRHGRTAFVVENLPSEIRVGCKHFTGKKAAALRTWAGE